MAKMSGLVEFFQLEEWFSVIDAGVLMLQHTDLNGCLFGIDNYANFRPLFADRGVPADRGESFAEAYDPVASDVFGETWVLFEELRDVNWDEPALGLDQRIQEYDVSSDGVEVLVGKWIEHSEYDWVRERIADAGEVRHGNKLFRREVLRRRDALEGTEFPLLMKLMEVLAARFGPRGVRLVVYFY